MLRALRDLLAPRAQVHPIPLDGIIRITVPPVLGHLPGYLRIRVEPTKVTTTVSRTVPDDPGGEIKLWGEEVAATEVREVEIHYRSHTWRAQAPKGWAGCLGYQLRIGPEFS